MKTYIVEFKVVVDAETEDEATQQAKDLISNKHFESYKVEEITEETK